MNLYITDGLRDYLEGMSIMSFLSIDRLGTTCLRQELYQQESEAMYVPVSPQFSIFRFTIGKHPLAWLDTIKGDNRTTTLSSSYQNGLLFEYQRECILSGHYEVARFLANQEALNSTLNTYEYYYGYSTGSRIDDDFPKVSDRKIFRHIRPRYLPEKMHLLETLGICLWCVHDLIYYDAPFTKILTLPCLGYFGYEFWKVYWRTHDSMLNSTLYQMNKIIIKFLHKLKII